MTSEMIEAIDVIIDSKLTRFELAKIRENPYKLGLIKDCRFQGKQLCIRKHNHCVMDVSGNKANIDAWKDIPEDDLPSVDVIKTLMNVLGEQDEQGFPAVTWGNDVIYTRRDIRLLYNLMSYIGQLKRSVRKEKEMVASNENPPQGLRDLARLPSCQKFNDFLWHSAIQSNRVHITPVQHSSKEEEDSLNMAEVYKAEQCLRYGINIDFIQRLY